MRPLSTATSGSSQRYGREDVIFAGEHAGRSVAAWRPDCTLAWQREVVPRPKQKPKYWDEEVDVQVVGGVLHEPRETRS